MNGGDSAESNNCSCIVYITPGRLCAEGHTTHDRSSTGVDRFLERPEGGFPLTYAVFRGLWCPRMPPKTRSRLPLHAPVRGPQPSEGSSGFWRLRPFLSVRPVPRHSRQMIHLGGSLPPSSVSGADQEVQPDPAQVEQRAFSGIRLSCWGIGPETSRGRAGRHSRARQPGRPRGMLLRAFAGSR